MKKCCCAFLCLFVSPLVIAKNPVQWIYPVSQKMLSHPERALQAVPDPIIDIVPTAGAAGTLACYQIHMVFYTDANTSSGTCSLASPASELWRYQPEQKVCLETGQTYRLSGQGIYQYWVNSFYGEQSAKAVNCIAIRDQDPGSPVSGDGTAVIYDIGSNGYLAPSSLETLHVANMLSGPCPGVGSGPSCS